MNALRGWLLAVLAICMALNVDAFWFKPAPRRLRPPPRTPSRNTNININTNTNINGNTKLINPCARLSCRNGGGCEVIRGRPRCQCPYPYYGAWCTRKNTCLGKTCNYHGSCRRINWGRDYQCRCNFPYYGKDCEQTKKVCEPSPCVNGGVCNTVSSVEYRCVCRQGFYGGNCQLGKANSDMCCPNPCQNGATCVNDYQGGSMCRCLPNFEGRYCENKIAAPKCKDGSDPQYEEPLQDGYCINTFDAFKITGVSYDECKAACLTKKDFDCKAINYYARTKICQLLKIDHNTASPAIIRKPNPCTCTGPCTYSIHKCPTKSDDGQLQCDDGSAPEWNHPFSSGVCIIGYNDKVINGISQQACKEACLRETSFVCKSFDYLKDRNVCNLSKQNQFSVSRNVIRKVYASKCEYFEYYCGDPSKPPSNKCDNGEPSPFMAPTNFQGNKCIYGYGKTRVNYVSKQECRNICYQTIGCMSIEYFANQGPQCWLQNVNHYMVPANLIKYDIGCEYEEFTCPGQYCTNKLNGEKIGVGQTYEAENCKTCTCTADGAQCVDTSCPILNCASTVAGLGCCDVCDTSCNEGFKYNERTQMCEDVNECWTNPCPAGHTCTNTIGSYACTAHCYSLGDPHIFTFDGNKRIDFMGTCTYTLAQPCGKGAAGLTGFKVSAKQERRGWRSSVAYNRYIDFEVYGTRIRLGKNKALQVDNQNMRAPVKLQGGAIDITYSGKYLRVVTKMGVTVDFDGYWQTNIYVPMTYKGKGMCGMCGNYNGDSNDEYMTRDGKNMGRSRYTSKRDFAVGQSWQTTDLSGEGGACAAFKPPPPPCHAGDKSKYQNLCGILQDKAGELKDCVNSAEMKASDAYSNCVYDACGNGDDHMSTICDSIASFVDRCRALPKVVPVWRKADFCPLACPANGKYQSDMNLCEPSCAVRLPECATNTGEGCQCNEGFLKSGDKCVPVSTCGCLTKDGYYMEEGDVNTNCNSTCECSKGKVTCNEYDPACDPGKICKLENSQPKCVCDEEDGYKTVLVNGAATCRKDDCAEAGEKLLETAQLCYVKLDGTYDRATARVKCQDIGGELPMIRNDETNTEVMNAVKKAGVPQAFLGLRSKSSSYWQWVDSRTMSAGDYQKFASAIDKPCAYIKPDGTWGTQGCHEKQEIVCQIPKNPGK